MKASVIISDTESQNRLLVDVLALCKQDLPSHQYEVILPDLGHFSAEEKTILAEFQKQYPNFRVIGNRGKRSFMLNEAVRQSRGELLFFVESHCLMHKTWLREFVDLFKNKKVQAARGFINTVPTDSWPGQGEEQYRKRVMHYFEELKVADSYFDFHNSAITRKCFDSMGGLSEDIPTLAEFELGAVLHQNGIKIVKFPQCAVWHFNDAAFSSYSRIVGAQGADKTRLLKRRGAKFMRQYFPLSRTFMRCQAFFRLFRFPLLLMEKTLIYGGIAGFTCAKKLHMNRLAMRFFKVFAESSHRYGLLSGLR